MSPGGRGSVIPDAHPPPRHWGRYFLQWEGSSTWDTCPHSPPWTPSSTWVPQGP